MKESDFNFAFCLVFGLVLIFVGLMIAGYCGAHTGSIKPILSAILGIFGGALLRSTHYTK